MKNSAKTAAADVPPMSEEEIFALLPAVSRTFALSIQALLPRACRKALQKGRAANPKAFARAFARKDAALANDIALAYLLCRLLDTVEDDSALPAKKRSAILRSLGQALADEEYTQKALNELGRAAPEIHAEAAEEELLRKAASLFARLRNNDLLPHTHSALSAVHSRAEYSPALRPRFAAMGTGPARYTEAICRHASEMAYGMADSVTDNTRGLIQSRADLDRYCHYVAGTVGAMLSDLFIAQRKNFPPKRAKILRANMESFARGLQLVNIIKDYKKDFAVGRCFIPEEIVRASGLTHEEFFSSSPELERRRHEALLPLMNDASGDLSRAVIYTCALPRRMRRARLFCVLPIVLARATLRMLMAVPKAPNKISAQGKAQAAPAAKPTSPKISRRRVVMLVILAYPAAISNLWLKFVCRK